MLIPDHETAVDFLNYEAISRTVVSLLQDNRQRALTVGIHGDWGAGKSSVLKMVEMEICKDKQVSCLWFNGWAFQGFDDAKTVLIEATINELCRQRSNVGKVKEIGARLIRRVDWLKVARHGSGFAFNLATGIPSPDQIGSALGSLRALAGDAKSMSPDDIEAKIAEVSSYLSDAEDSNVPEQIHQFREDFAELLNEAKIDQLVVLIDDLDRCLPETAINTLEAIRLFLFVPKTAFVIGADEAMIEYAVRQHFPDLPLASGPMPYARNYLEKLIQVPFRLPALGTQETRAYVTLLLVESLVGDDHAGFKALLDKARDILSRPWLGTGLSRDDVKNVDPSRQRELDATYVLAQQIGPILAEGTRGNPRQVKRFLNALLVRQVIAKARGFGDSIHQSVLAKLMLAERFQPDFYEHIAGRAMIAEDGKVTDLTLLEDGGDGKKGDKGAKTSKEENEAAPSVADVAKWLEREWLQRWLKIQPALGDIDLRPYVFVARDKRMLAGAAELGGLEGLIEKLSGPAMAVRMAEPEVKALTATDAEHLFSALREKILGHGSFNAEPPGFTGAGVVAKHHSRFQRELVGLLAGIDAKSLGMWVVAGWNEILTEQAAKDDLRTLQTQWANQDDNQLLKRAASGALAGRNKGAR